MNDPPEPQTGSDEPQNRRWIEKEFRASDSVRLRGENGVRLERKATGQEEDPRLTVVPDGWDHEHCGICWETISERPEGETVGFTDGKKWLCRSCYEESVLHRPTSGNAEGQK